MAKRVTRNISLTPQMDRFVASLVKSGSYESASEVVRDAVRALQHRRKADAAKLARLRADLQKGLDDIERGDVIDGEELMAELRRLDEQDVRTKRRSA